MMWLRTIFIVLSVYYVVCKEQNVYEVSGIELIDLIRGFKPKDNKLKLTKVEGDMASLPDGIYFQPEDDALSPEEYKYLHFNGQEAKSGWDKKQDGITTSK